MVAEITEALLLPRLRSGDARAFEELVRSYTGRLLRVSSSRSGRAVIT